MSARKVTNKEVVNAIVNEGSAEMRERLQGVDSQQVLNTLENYPTVRNEFINALINKIAKPLFFSKVFNNPLKMLHKGTLPYGSTLEQIFVEMAERKGYGEHFTGSDTVEGDLIRKITPNVKVDYISKNFEYKYKQTITNIMLQNAFHNETGLIQMVQQLNNSIFNKAYYDEYVDMKNILVRAEEGNGTNGENQSKGAIHLALKNAGGLEKAVVTTSGDFKELAMLIREYASTLKFPSKDYNLAGVTTFTEKEDLVFFTTPKVEAGLDVNVLATAFNVSCADVPVRTITVDDLGVVLADGKTDLVGKKILGVLADKDLIQQWDTVNSCESFRNAEQGITNVFLHRHGISAFCKFANMIVFVGE